MEDKNCCNQSQSNHKIENKIEKTETDNNKNNEPSTIKISIDKILIGLIIIAGVVILFNQFQLAGLKNINVDANIPTGLAVAEASEVLPKGIPEIYGSELGISYDYISVSNPGLADETIKFLGSFDDGIQLSGKELERYVNITSQISCEYCCGANSIIFTKEDEDAMAEKIENAVANGQITKEQADRYRIRAGDAACGCAHSYAMRGLAKYLLQKHANEFTDDEILEELAKWKTLFFPGNMAAKAKILKEKGIEFNYINLGSNKYRGIEQGSSSGGMVGGC